MIYSENDVRFVHAELECYIASSPKQQSGVRHVVPLLGHIILLSCQLVFVIAH